MGLEISGLRFNTEFGGVVDVLVLSRWIHLVCNCRVGVEG